MAVHGDLAVRLLYTVLHLWRLFAHVFALRDGQWPWWASAFPLRSRLGETAVYQRVCGVWTRRLGDVASTFSFMRMFSNHLPAGAVG